ncbi:aspartate 4-decarboxylase [uncultured Clostridium sp.]|uniref:aspartate 4-decarboxylase n=1 Tax=uncultured Clostridium sp. TaxID=59620 RepID=UPI002602AE84|nr:aspartate 4-decarboxylase [uncultured Clostridium sp.]
MKNIQEEEIEKIYGKVSPFEFKDELINLATRPEKKSTRALLDAGRGNPNWISTTPREAFFTFGQFAITESKRVWEEKDLGGMPHKNGIYDRFKKFVKNNETAPGIELLDKIVEYGVFEKNFDKDRFVHELTDAIIGDNYPFPDRMLIHIEALVHEYLTKEMSYDTGKGGKFDIFAVEGATAAMCYIFDTLKANNLLVKGDKIAIMVPVFTPYLEIPVLPQYELEIVPIIANSDSKTREKQGQYPDEELDKLKDPKVKALFIVNPSNPSSIALDCDGRSYIANIVENYNKDLMVISDDVYGTFVEDFKSLMAEIPYNTIGVYSFSKYFGVTGWRLGTIALHENNVFDKLIAELPNVFKRELRSRYGHLSTTPEKISFIDRIVADSRQVALNHTAGLSTPQQVQMAFFCMFAVLDKNDDYKNLTMDICKRRKKLLYDGLGIDLKLNPLSAHYYVEFDLLDWAENNYGSDFAIFLEDNYKPVQVLYRLAKESSIVLLGGSGFQGPQWSIRISLANLNDEAYKEIGHALRTISQGFLEEFKASTVK